VVGQQHRGVGERGLLGDVPRVLSPPLRSCGGVSCSWSAGKPGRRKVIIVCPRRPAWTSFRRALSTTA
jgi:hypothetical protein